MQVFENIKDVRHAAQQQFFRLKQGRRALQHMKGVTGGSGSAYAGDVSPPQAWDVLRNDPDAVLVDVRTNMEWAEGLPNLVPLEKTVVTLSWKELPSMQVNPVFVQELQRVVGDKHAALFFLCRTGGRSQEAAIAMTQAGYTRCYNVTDGFEGPADGNGQRGTIAGWKAEGLPWGQN